MNTVNDITVEVETLANQVSLDVLLKHFEEYTDRRKHTITVYNQTKVKQALEDYIAAKKLYKRTLQKLNDDFSLTMSSSQELKLLNELQTKLERARLNYYVTKHQFEPNHVTECTCRGCRCIEQLSRRHAIETCYSIDRTRVDAPR